MPPRLASVPTTGSRPRGVMRCLLLEAAQRRIEEHGRESVSLRSLASDLTAAGTPVTHTALLAHFRGLDALLADIAAGWWNECAEVLENARRGHRSATAQLAALSAAYVTFAIDSPHRFRLMYDTKLWLRSVAAEQPDVADDFADGRDRGFAEFVEAALAGQHTGHLSPALSAVTIARLVASLSHGLAMEFLDERLGEGPSSRRADTRRWQLAHAAELVQLAIRGVEVNRGGRRVRSRPARKTTKSKVLNPIKEQL